MVEMVPQTTFAVRRSGETGWRLLSWDCEPDDLDRRLEEMGMTQLERRFVGTSHVRPGLEGYFTASHALRAGWQRDWDSDLWFPIDEALPRLPGEPTGVTEVYLSLRRIMFGGVFLTVRAGDRIGECYICDVEDSLVMLARFTKILADGGQPHAPLANRNKAHFIVQDLPDRPGMVRFYCKPYQVVFEQEILIDCVTRRADLTVQFRELTRAIANHPNLAHHWICHADLRSDAYGRVADAADAEWERGVLGGTHADDWNAQQDYCAARISAEVPLPDYGVQLAARYREMLRTLEIPDDWR
jgi:hypothetical protein